MLVAEVPAVLNATMASITNGKSNMHETGNPSLGSSADAAERMHLSIETRGMILKHADVPREQVRGAPQVVPRRGQPVRQRGRVRGAVERRGGAEAHCGGGCGAPLACLARLKKRLQAATSELFAGSYMLL